MEYTVNLKLKIADSDVEGESSQKDNDREGTIECLQISCGVQTQRDPLHPTTSTGRSFNPIEILKRVDKSSPLLLKACTNNEKVEGVFCFFRPSPAGDSTSEHFYTIEISDARIESVTQSSGTRIRAQENIRFVYSSIRWVFEPTGAEAVDSVSGEV